MTSSYFDNKNEANCTGCRACEALCPVDAISMVENGEGFMYPEICEDKCVQCNLCRDRCPMNFQFKASLSKKTYAAQYKEKGALKRSSSGGMFIAIAEHVISKGGIVYGCILDEDNNAVIKGTRTSEGLVAMQGSKYVSSDTLNTFCEAKQNLQNGDLVLYTGTPCQTAGLLSFLNHDFPNLITMDFLCHGVPSSKMFKAFIDDLGKSESAHIQNYKFRDKSKSGWGLVESYELNNKKKYIFPSENNYLKGFLSGYFNRYSCYNCNFAGPARKTDFTVADYWGVRSYHKEFKAEQGVSILLANTDKAVNLLDSIKTNLVLAESDIADMARENPSLKEGCESHSISEVRKVIYGDLAEKGFGHLKENQLKTPFSLSNFIKNRMPKSLKKFIRYCMGG